MKPSSENLLHACQMAINAHIEKRSDLSEKAIKLILDLKAEILYLKEIDCD